MSKKQHEQTSTCLPVLRVRRKRGGKRREQKSGYSGLSRRKTGQTEAGWVEGSINSFAAGAPTYKSAAEDPRSIVNLVIVCCVSVTISDSIYAETHQCFLAKSILELKTREKQENCRDFKSTSQEVDK